MENETKKELSDFVVLSRPLNPTEEGRYGGSFFIKEKEEKSGRFGTALRTGFYLGWVGLSVAAYFSENKTYDDLALAYSILVIYQLGARSGRKEEGRKYREVREQNLSEAKLNKIEDVIYKRE